MKLLFVSMTPLVHNTSAMIRTWGYIIGAKKNGNRCDALTLKAEENDILFDDSYRELVVQYIDHYYTFERNKEYEKLKAKKHKQNNLFDLAKNIIKKIYKLYTVYDVQNVNVPNVKTVEIEFDSYDRIISISDPVSSHNLILELIQAGKILDAKKKWIQCWGDPWYLDMTRSHGLQKGIVYKEEKKILEEAYKVVYVSPFTYKSQKKLYEKCAEKMVCINQVSFVNDNGDFLRDEDFKLGYFGAYQSNVRNIMPLYNCCKAHKYNLMIVGDTDIVLDNTETISVSPQTNRKESEMLERKCSVIICICNKIGTQIPGKVYYQSGYQKPIIIILDGENASKMGEYFNRFNRFILCYNNEESILSGLKMARAEILEGKKYKLDKKLTDIYCASKLLEDKVDGIC